MNPINLIGTLKRLGFGLRSEYQDGWRLTVRGNPALLPEQLRVMIAENKDALLDHLWQEQPVSAGPNWERVGGPVELEEVYYLSWDDGKKIAVSRAAVDAIIEHNRRHDGHQNKAG
jgi:hypothetical protein